MERAYIEELKSLGNLAQRVRVSIAEDRVHGRRAAIRVTPAEGVSPETVKGRIREILAFNTIHFEVDID